MRIGRPLVALLVLLLLAQFAVQAQPASPPLDILGDDRLVIDANNSASDVIWLRNNSTKPLSLMLAVRQFTSDATRQIIPGKGAVSAVDGMAAPFLYKPGVRLAPGAQMPLRITITEFWSIGEASAALTNHGAAIGTIRVIKDRFPFKVAPPGWKEGVPYPVRVSADNDARITLVNEEPVRYVVAWVFAAPGMGDLKGEITIPPSTARTITLHPQKDDSWSGDTLLSLFRDRDVDAWLTLSAVPAEQASFLNWWPSRHLPIKLSRSWWSDVWRPWVANALIVFLLLAGGICSLILTNWVPNRTLKLNLQRRLEDVAEEIRTISSAVDSVLRVSIRVERLRIKDSLNSRQTFSADYPALARACEIDIVRLERLVGVVQKIDAVYRSAHSSVRGFAPSIMLEAMRTARDAEMQVIMPKVTDSSIDDATKTLASAGTTLASLREPATTLMEKLAQRVERVTSDARFTRSDFLKEARTKIPNLDVWVNSAFANVGKIHAQNFSAIDAATTKYEILLDVADIIDKMDQEQKKKWSDVIERLVKNLRADNLSLLRRADLRARELREDVHQDDVIAEIKAGRFTIVCEPNLPGVGDTARFRVIFHDRQISNSAAREEIACQWDFGDDLKESGWQVAHYYRRPSKRRFRKAGLYDVSVTFNGEKTIELPSNGAHLPVKVGEASTATIGGYTTVELLRLSIALFIAVLGLLSGANEQVVKLDLIPALIAVFMIGFTADQIKNIFVAKPAAPPVSAGAPAREVL